MTTTPGDESQDRPEDGTEETAPLPPGTQPEGWQPQWQPQYPGSGQPGGAPSGAPYAPTPQGHYAYQAPEHPQATTVLVLGILSVVLCQVLGPFAWIQGKRALAEIDASQGRIGGRGQVQIGYVLGIVGTVLLGFALLFMVAWLAFALFAIGGVMTTGG